MNIFFLSIFASTLIWSIIYEKIFFIIFLTILLTKYLLKTISSKKSLYEKIFEKPSNPSIHTIIPIKLDKIDKYLMEYNKKNPDNRITYTHIGMKALSVAMMTYRRTNAYISYNNLYSLDTSSIGVIVSVGRNDLTAKVIENVENYTISQLPSTLNKSVKNIKKGKDKKLNNLNKSLKFMPSYVFNLFAEITAYLIFNFLYKIKQLTSIRKNCAIAGLTNVSKFKLKEAIACHISLGRSAYALLMGSAEKIPVVVKGKIEVQKVMNIGIICDQRLGNGDDFLLSVKKIEEVFINFQKYIN